MMLVSTAGQGRASQCAITCRRIRRPAGPAACCWAEKGRRSADQSCTGPAAKAAEPHAEPAAIASPTIPSWLPRAETPTRACLGHEDSALLILADLCEPAPLLARRMCSCSDPAVGLGRCWCSVAPGSHCRAACRGCHRRWALPPAVLTLMSMLRCYMPMSMLLPLLARGSSR